jgi:hypothetical protein
MNFFSTLIPKQTCSSRLCRDPLRPGRARRAKGDRARLANAGQRHEAGMGRIEAPPSFQSVMKLRFTPASHGAPMRERLCK